MAPALSPSEPSASSDGALTVGVHWFRATTFGRSAEDVAYALAEALGESVEVRDGGKHLYDRTHVIGAVQLWSHTAKPDMGVCVEVTGGACEELGTEGLIAVWGVADWRASRVDLAVDECPFTPAQVRDAWVAGNVRTRVKSMKDALPGREDVRASEWNSKPTGDLFGMGRRASMQYARVYDRRGFTRFELEVKGKTAAAVAPEVLGMLSSPGFDALPRLALSLVRRFVDFVQADADSNISRAPLLAWWAAFVVGVEKSALVVSKPVTRAASDVLDYVLAQVAPSLSVLRRVFGPTILLDLARDGDRRLKRRHRETLRLAGVS